MQPMEIVEELCVVVFCVVKGVTVDVFCKKTSLIAQERALLLGFNMFHRYNKRPHTNIRCIENVIAISNISI